MNFILFNNIRKSSIMENVLKNYGSDVPEDFNEALGELISFAIELQLNGNIWQMYLAYTLIFNENSFTRLLEKKNLKIQNHDIVRFDIQKYYDLFQMDFQQTPLLRVMHFDLVKFQDETILSRRIKFLTDNLVSAKDFEEFYYELICFYQTFGVGEMSIYKAFRVEKGILSPIEYTQEIQFEDIIGYEAQKMLLIENTKMFLQNKTCNNVLLYGDSGTGKSTSIKALLNHFYKDGLRIIEVYKHQMSEISKIINELQKRRYHFIIYMDDLSFEEEEVEYKYLKSIIEGGIEPKPSNVLIYATSNRKHLIKETMSDNGAGYSDDLHRNETQAEKLSLAYRFGIQIYYSSLSPKEFRKMVQELVLRNDLTIEETQLIKEASAWELTYGSLSGRCATQFVQYLTNKIKDGKKNG